MTAIMNIWIDCSGENDGWLTAFWWYANSARATAVAAG